LGGWPVDQVVVLAAQYGMATSLAWLAVMMPAAATLALHRNMNRRPPSLRATAAVSSSICGGVHGRRAR
jgi:hypothetical protein